MFLKNNVKYAIMCDNNTWDKERKCPSIINKINLDEYNNKLSDNNKT